jgi:hypothetical protein
MIDYNKIGTSIDFYTKNDFVRIEAPWMVTEEISGLTKPPHVLDYHVPECHKVLVASGEQSFLYLANKGILAPGKYQTTTPCFRNEPIDLLHRKCFIKNELIQTVNINNQELEKMIKNAFDFFSIFINKDRLKIIKTPATQSIVSYDIVAIVNNQELELGSYGIRKCEILKWIYGTGCAEPRLSLIMNRIKLEEDNV